jgi:hypothetical protein
MKVLVNGCSHLQGCDLHDDESVCRTMTWPNLVLGWQVTNIAEAASSNDSIRRRTIDHFNHHDDYDFVYVQWSYFDRIELQIPEWDLKHMHKPWYSINAGNAQHCLDHINGNGAVIHQIARSVFLEQFDQSWLRDYSILQMLCLQEFFRAKGIRYRFGFVMDVPDQGALADLLDTERMWSPTWVNFCNGRFTWVEQHWGQDAHQAWAKSFGDQLT